MLTKADIPPGGEGKIEVTFSTKGKKGSQRKTITITSNDPDEPTTRVYVEAYIEVAFGFESYGLNMGTVPRDEAVSKTTNLLIKNPQTTQVTDFTTSSEYVTVREVSRTQDSLGTKVEVEVTVKPGIKPGRLNETVTAHSNLAGHKQAAIRISGAVKGDINLVPDMLRFDRYPSDSNKTTWERTLRIVNESEERPLEILSVENPKGHLHLDLETLEAGEAYKVIARLNDEELIQGTYFSGRIRIHTNSQLQEWVEARYMIYNRN